MRSSAGHSGWDIARRVMFWRKRIPVVVPVFDPYVIRGVLAVKQIQAMVDYGHAVQDYLKNMREALKRLQNA